MRGGVVFLFAFFSSMVALAGEIDSAACSAAIANVQKQVQNAFSGAHASILIQQGDRRLLASSFGSGVTEHTRFLLGSVTKTIHAAVATSLWSEGKLDLESTISSVLPPELVSAIPQAWQAVRVRNLLHMTSGIPDYLNRGNSTDQQASNEFLKVAHDFRQLIGFLPPALEFQPDTELKYSNTNYLILGRILEARGGASDLDLLKQRIIGMLGLSDTGTILQSDSSILGGTGIYPSNMEGVGNVYSSAHDLMEFMRGLDTQKLFPATWVERMFQADAACHGSSCERYGLGFSLRDPGILGHRWVFHEGHLNTVSSMVAKIADLEANISYVSDRVELKGEALAASILTELVQAKCFVTSPMP